MPTTVCTAYRGVVSLGQASEGMRVLIFGASGSVGSAMAQIAVALGCRVWGTCGKKNRAYVESLGVAAMEYDAPLSEALAGAAAPTHFELVLDAVGGDDLYAASLPLLAPRTGKFITAVGPVRHGGSEVITVRTLLSTASTLVPRMLFARRRYTLFLSFDVADLHAPPLLELVEAGKLRVRVDPQHFDLSGLAAAHAKCESNHSDGRIVVQVAEG